MYGIIANCLIPQSTAKLCAATGCYWLLLLLAAASAVAAIPVGVGSRYSYTVYHSGSRRSSVQ